MNQSDAGAKYLRLARGVKLDKGSYIFISLTSYSAKDKNLNLFSTDALRKMGYNPLTGKDVTVAKTPTPKKSDGWNSPSEKKNEGSPSTTIKDGNKRVILVDEDHDAGEVCFLFVICARLI